MSIKRRITIVITATAICALCAFVVWFGYSRGPKITGKISPHDLDAISELVDRQGVFSLVGNPQTIRLSRGRIIGIAASDDAVKVDRILLSEKGLTRGVTYTLKKPEKQWEIAATKFWIGPESLR